jgi:pimeloyl-ACP methyl ester carboxylesterase
LQYLWKNSEEQKAANQFILDALKINTTSDAINFFVGQTGHPYFVKNINTYMKAWNQPNAANSTIAWFKANFIGYDLKNIKTTFPCCLTIDVPTLILWGSKDPMYLFKENTDLIPTYLNQPYTIKEFPLNGHWILHENPRDVTDAMKQFIRKL